AQAAGTSSSSSSTPSLPNGYSKGVYSFAKTDADIREGFKGDPVTSRQQMLKDQGYDLGKSGKSGNGVDGYWGTTTQKAWNQYMADTHGNGSAGRSEYTKENPAT